MTLTFQEQRAYVQKYFIDLDAKEGNKVHDTKKGIFGTTDITLFVEFCEKINLASKKSFVDLGSGDGRLVLLASLYTQAIGLEFDADLIKISMQHQKKLSLRMPEVFQAKFLEQDYELFDYLHCDVLFSFADHFFTPEFIEKLKNEFFGTLYVFQGVFLPEGLKNQKKATLWLSNQTPVHV
ncbi:MAG: hypothetical protein ACLFNM_03230, partial [Candidatus Woesearchaeota archaeon]